MCSVSKGVVVTATMHIRLTHETSLFYGKPPRRPPDPNLVIYVSQYVAPLIDLGGVEIFAGYNIAQRFLGRIKEEG